MSNDKVGAQTALCTLQLCVPSKRKGSGGR